jgi:hypothetical protein
MRIVSICGSDGALRKSTGHGFDLQVVNIACKK